MASPPYPAVSRWMLRHLNRAADLLPVVPARLGQAWHVWTSVVRKNFNLDIAAVHSTLLCLLSFLGCLG